MRSETPLTFISIWIGDSYYATDVIAVLGDVPDDVLKDIHDAITYLDPYN